MNTGAPLTIKDKRYETASAREQQFEFDDDARSVLYNCCGQCSSEMGCDAAIALRRGLENGNPQWTGDFVKLRLTTEFLNRKYSLGDKEAVTLPDEIFVCKRFELV